MKKLIVSAFVCALSFLLVSCNKNNSEPYYEATATIKTATQDQTCYFQIDEETALVSSNDFFKTNPYKKEVRAVLRYFDRGEATKPAWSTTPKWRKGELTFVDTILTKKPIPDGIYKVAPIELVNSWVNIIEDGYMTLCFECWWGGTGTTHVINLARTEDPHVFRLIHDNNGDPAVFRGTGLVAFDIHDMPIPQGKEFDVLLKYVGYTTDKVVAFHYKDGKFSSPTRVDVNGYLE